MLSAALLGMCFAMNAQGTGETKKMDKKMDKMEKKEEMKAHACTAACKDGHHVYAHGEKGHHCTDACHKPKM